MASLITTLKPLPPSSSSFVKQKTTSGNNSCNALFSTYHKPNSTNSFPLKKRGSVARKTQTFVAVREAPNQVESPWTIPFSEVVVVRDKTAFWERSWNSKDVSKFITIVGIHLLSLLAPFYFTWAALGNSIIFSVATAIFITVSYHRNLAHRTFDLPKWLEYLLAYGGLHAFQGDPIEWVSNHRYHHTHSDTQRDPHSTTQGLSFGYITWMFQSDSILKKCGGEENVKDIAREPFYRFLQKTVLLHYMASALVFYFWGGMPLLVWGYGVASVLRFHATLLGHSLGHIWGKRAYNTPDLSKNIWWLAILTWGEGWHNNHHAFEFSAKMAHEWWQLDGGYYIVRFLEAIGLATNVKVHTEAQKKKLAVV